MCVVIVKHELVDIDLADTSRDTLLRDFVGESVCTMEHNAHSARYLLSNGFKSVIIVSWAVSIDLLNNILPRVVQLWSDRTIFSVYVANRRSKEVDAGSDEILHFIRSRKYTLHACGVCDAIFATFDPARLRFRGNTSCMTVCNQLFGLSKILVLLVMRHVHHDGIERQVIRC